MSNRRIVVARAPQSIARDRNLLAVPGEFIRGWWAGQRHAPIGTPMTHEYYAGYEAGLAWRDFQGLSRRAHETHAEDALRLDQEGSMTAAVG